MSKQTIYASDIKPFASVISLLDGSSDFAVESPYFPLPGTKPCDPKLWMKSIADGKGGLFLNSPKIFHKGPTGVFTSSFVIGWTSVVQNQKLKKEYRINSPYNQEALKRKQKLMVSTLSHKLSLDDNALLLFSWQLSMTLDVLLISKILQLDLSKYAGMPNDKFYPAFATDAAVALKKKRASKAFQLDQKLIEAWNTVPICSKTARKDDIFIYDTSNTQTAAFIPLMQTFFDSVITIPGKKPFPELDAIERVWAHPNCFSIPSLRLRCYIPEGEEAQPVQVIDSRLTFICKVLPGDKEFNEKFPDGLCTTWLKSKTNKTKLTKAELPQLWGNTVYTPNSDNKHESARFSGCIFLQPQAIFSFHEKGCPGLEWRVDTIALTKINRVVSDEVEDALNFIGDEEQPPAATGGHGSDAEGADFVEANENEFDPDAL